MRTPRGPRPVFHDAIAGVVTRTARQLEQEYAHDAPKHLLPEVLEVLEVLDLVHRAMVSAMVRPWRSEVIERLE